MMIHGFDAEFSLDIWFANFLISYIYIFLTYLAYILNNVRFTGQCLFGYPRPTCIKIYK